MTTRLPHPHPLLYPSPHTLPTHSPVQQTFLLHEDLIHLHTAPSRPGPPLAGLSAPSPLSFIVGLACFCAAEGGTLGLGHAKHVWYH